MKYLKKRKQAWAALILLLFCFFIFLTGVLPSDNNFEASLAVKEMRFTYDDQNSDKLLMNNINGIKKLLVDGRQSNMTLEGKFISSISHPELNQKLTQRKILKIELPSDDSQLMIAPADSKLESQLKLTELRLQPQTIIDSLSYNPSNKRLAISVSPKGKSKNRNFILNLGDQALQISLKKYKLPELDFQNSSDSSKELEFIFKPINPSFELFINSKTRLSIDLPDPNKVNSEEWLRGDLVVKHMEFKNLNRTGKNFSDDLVKSTIIKGDIRMREQELKIESDQFLIIEGSGINYLRYLEIIPPKTTPEVELRINSGSVDISEPVEGIKVGIAGKAKLIQVGIDQSLPVNSIQSSFLAGVGFSKDSINTIISFLLGVMASIVAWLVNDFLSWNP